MEQFLLELTHYVESTNIGSGIYGTSVYIDASKITSVSQMYERFEGKKVIYTALYLEGSFVVIVKETPKEIQDKIIMGPPQLETEPTKKGENK